MLLKYFDDKLAALFVQDTECTQKTGDLCKLTSTVIYGAQDADIKDLRVCEPPPKSDWVEAHFLNFGKPQVVFFQVKKTSRRWRVADVRYDDDPDGIVKMLSEP